MALGGELPPTQIQHTLPIDIGEIVNNLRTRPLIAAPFAFLLMLGACSSDSKTTAKTTATDASAASTAISSVASTVAGDGNKTAYCGFISGIESALRASGGDPTAALAAIKSFEPKMDQAIADAPAALKAGVTLEVQQARAALAANSLDAVNNPENQAAATADDAYCGLTTPSSDVAPSGGLTTTIPATVNS